MIGTLMLMLVAMVGALMLLFFAVGYASGLDDD